jgi:hypothetical protein
MAAVINVFLPGIGHLVTGRVIQGLLLFVIITALYLSFFGIPLAIILHVLVIIDAARDTERKRKRELQELAKVMKQR